MKNFSTYQALLDTGNQRQKENGKFIVIKL